MEKDVSFRRWVHVNGKKTTEGRTNFESSWSFEKNQSNHRSHFFQTQTMSYQEPEWAVKPSQGEWYLTEIKGGMEVGKYRLDKRATTIFGRATDMVHIPLNHESASRQHARISFDSQGIPWLRDLKSTHGTACNKRPLPPQACLLYTSDAADE